jgi:pimeloyl-ACP methyl ester carboxylesterase
VTGVTAFLEKIADARAGDVVTLEVVRDGVRAEKRVTLKEKPREAGDGYEVIYASVKSRGARLRTIITRPKVEGRHPAVMLIQGYGCFSIDHPIGPPGGFTRIARDLARHGYVTLRVDRPGCGDSEGGPCQDIDFHGELDCYRQALQALKQQDFVAADNVLLFGHSMGGAMAGFLAAEVPVRGIAVYGAGADTWFEGILGQRRRIALLDGTDPAEVDRKILREARFWYPLLVEKKTPGEILKQHPELRNGFGTASGNGWVPMVTEDKYVGGRHYTFHHQASSKNLAGALAKVAATRLPVGGNVPSARAPHPRVLAMWGKSDWQVDRAATAWIAEVVNRVKPGAGTFVALESIDHVFLRAATPEESYRFFNPAKGTPPGEFNPVILATLRAWLNETAGKAKKG